MQGHAQHIRPSPALATAASCACHAPVWRCAACVAFVYERLKATIRAVDTGQTPGSNNAIKWLHTHTHSCRPVVCPSVYLGHLAAIVRIFKVESQSLVYSLDKAYKSFDYGTQM